MEQFIDAVLATIKAVADRLSARIDALEQRPIVAGRDGRDGLPGAPGDRGPEGEKGADGADGRDGADGKDGAPGRDGRDGIDGKDGEPGADGKPGQDGLRGERGEKGIDGRDGKDGANGRDGIALDLEDLQTDMVYDGERTYTLTFKRGPVVKTFDLRFPVPLYRDLWTDGKSYEVGDVVTWGGSMWIATKDTSAKPDLATAGSRAWKLCVKRGREGKQGAKGEVLKVEGVKW